MRAGAAGMAPCLRATRVQERQGEDTSRGCSWQLQEAWPHPPLCAHLLAQRAGMDASSGGRRPLRPCESAPTSWAG